MSTSTVRANDIDICFETFGDPAHPALLLVMGLGVQLTEWEPEFVQMFVDHGLHVIRFDNRDTGLSTHFHHIEPNVAAARRGDRTSAPYTLFDMADDAVALLDALGIARAHVVGASMGGMVAQTIAISHPERVLSLCSIMSGTGDPTVGRATPEALAALTAPAPIAREDVIEAAVERGKVFRGGGFPYEPERIRRRATAAYDRAHDPAGKARQQAAVIASGDRTEALRSLRVPTVVIHGEADPLATLGGGQATAAAIPDATLVVIPGMGHEFPIGARPQIVEAAIANIRRAG